MPLKNKRKPLDSFDALSGLAQELDAPLCSLLLSSQKLIDDYKSRNFEYVSFKDFKKIITTLEQMNRQLKRCCLTTQRMTHLNNHSLGNSTDSSCQVSEVIDEVTALLGQQLEAAKIKLVLRLNDHLPVAALSKVECHQVVHNVLINAIQSMPAGGKIKIRTGVDQAKNMITLDVEDEGVGITPEHLSKIFEPFFSTKERGVDKSAGLGLSIVYAIVHAIGGDISIQSSLRKGTMVHLDLPCFISKK